MALRDHAIWWPGLLTAPVLLGQALLTRLSTPLLPSAQPPLSGTCSPRKRSTAHELSIYLVGESTVAGVGATRHDLGLSGQLAQRLAESSSAPVRWEALGLIGARARDCLRFQIELELLPKMEKNPANLIVVVLGVNDTTKLTSRTTWRESLRQIVRRIGENSTCPTLFAGVPPMEHFSALPQPLRTMLGARARMLDDDMGRIARESPSTHHQRTGTTFDTAYLAADGFHPSELGYAVWAEDLAELASSVLTGAE